MRRTERGFTLVEMIVVIAVLAILAATASVSIADINTMRRDMAARKIVSDIRLAQDLAIARHFNTWVAFDITTNQYTMYLENPLMPGKANRRIAKDPLTQGTFIIPLGDQKNPGVQLTSVDIGGTPEIHFDKFGFPTNADDVRLTIPGFIMVNMLRKISITPGTGRVQLE